MTETVIIAVNDPNILYLLQRYVEESGFLPVAALHGPTILNLLTRQPSPALLILDMGYPEVSGPETLSELQAAAATHSVPIVLYSCVDEPPDTWREVAAAYLPKSVMYTDFVDALKRAGVEMVPAGRA
jgi:CheY-like chemotaxis protein